jgi:anaerobic ribonucleoside-triphosphate reductase activating protein
MNILCTQYNLEYKSLDVFVSGCKPPHCKGCCNPETWDFNQGEMYDNMYYKKLIAKIKYFSTLIKNIMIMGGEPLDQNINELEKFILDLKVFKIPIWLFTKYEIKKVPDNIKVLCDYIKCGKYDNTQLSKDNIWFGITLASKNQKIYKLNGGQIEHESN